MSKQGRRKVSSKSPPNHNNINQIKMKKKQAYHTTNTSVNAGAAHQLVSSGSSNHGMGTALSQQVNVIPITQSSSTTNATSHVAGGSNTKSLSTAKKRNMPSASGPSQQIVLGNELGMNRHSIGGVPSTSSGIGLQLGGGSQKKSNFHIDAQAYSSHQPSQLQQNKKQGGATKISGQHQKMHSNSGAVTTKNAAVKSSMTTMNQGVGGNWKFVERRLSAKVLQDPQSRKSQGVGATAKTTAGGAIQYENLMLQQLLKQQQKMDLEKQQAATAGGGGFKKNLSVISIEPGAPPT